MTCRFSEWNLLTWQLDERLRHSDSGENEKVKIQPVLRSCCPGMAVETS